MASAKAVAWVERLVWILIYGGLLALVIGLATLADAPAAGWPLVVAGACAAAVGVILIWVRSRMSGPG